MKKKPYIAETDKEMKMVFDPYRLRIIYTVEKSKEPLTVKQIASIIGEPANKVHYHVKKLYDFGYFELVKTENINGIIAKYYDNKYLGPFFGKPARDLEDFPAHIRSLTSALDAITNQFKGDLVDYSNLKDENGKHPGGALYLEHLTLYMTQEESRQVVKDVEKVLGKYIKEDTSKQVFTTIQTIARIK